MPAPWFVHGEDGTLRAVSREGKLAFALAAAWILISGLGGMALFLRAPGAGAVAAPFVSAALGFAVFAYFAVTRTAPRQTK